MGLSMLPDELLLTLAEQWPCRETQSRQLGALLSLTKPSPSTLVVYGPRATGKSRIVDAYLQASKLRHAIVRCRECVTGRQFLERTVAAVHESLHTGEDEAQGTGDYSPRCENLGALVVHLQRLLEHQPKFVLVLDGIDTLRDSPPTLLPALARLGEYIPHLSTLLILSHPSSRLLHTTGIPHIHFPPYTRNQSIHILSLRPPDIFLTPPPPELNYDEEVHEEDKKWLWPRFCATVWDSLAQAAARDLVAFRDVCHKLWRPFVGPIVRGEFGTRDFSRLVVRQRRLFQGEEALVHSLLAPLAGEEVGAEGVSVVMGKDKTHELPYYAKWLLIAAYLASFNPARLDALYFMKSTEKKRKKKGGGTPRSGGRASQQRKIPRHLLSPAAFTLDRLLAILHAILPHDFRSTVDVYTLLATLTGLRLLSKGGGLGSSDPLEPGGKWRVANVVSWEYVQAIARSVKFEIVDFVAE